MGRKFYTHDKKTTYTFRGLLISGTILVPGEYDDPPGQCTRITTHKVSDVKFCNTPISVAPKAP